MPKIDWTEQAESNFGKAGVYMAIVERCEVKTAKRTGAAYFDVVLVAADFYFEGKNKFLCYDNIMLSGEGRRLGQAKLRALGFNPDDEELEPYQLVNRRAWVWIGKSADNNGKIRRGVDLVFDWGFHAGYCSAAEAPHKEWPLIPWDEKDHARIQVGETPF